MVCSLGFDKREARSPGNGVEADSDMTLYYCLNIPIEWKWIADKQSSLHIQQASKPAPQKVIKTVDRQVERADIFKSNDGLSPRAQVASCPRACIWQLI